jgi:hypothetical protein
MKICRNLLLHFGKKLTKKAFWVNVSAFFLPKSRFFFGTNGQGSLCFWLFYTFCEQQLNVHQQKIETHGMEAHWHGQRSETVPEPSPNF